MDDKKKTIQDICIAAYLAENTGKSYPEALSWCEGNLDYVEVRKAFNNTAKAILNGKSLTFFKKQLKKYGVIK